MVSHKTKKHQHSFIEEDEPEQKVQLCAVEIQEAISDLEDTEPDKRKREHKLWVNKINSLMKEYNDRFGRMYILIK